jgi:hypothetical protein
MHATCTGGVLFKAIGPIHFLVGADSTPPHDLSDWFYTEYAIWFRVGMKIIAELLVVMLLALCAQAASVQGDITIPYIVIDTNKTVQTKDCGDDVKASWKCRLGESYGWETIFAHVTITNTGSKPMWGQCSVAFYDQDKNLVGTATQNFIARRGLNPEHGSWGCARLFCQRTSTRTSFHTRSSLTKRAPHLRNRRNRFC